MVSDEEIDREKARDRGVLSPSDREAVLRSEENYLKDKSPQALSQRKQAIRTRTRNAFKDMSLLYEHLDDETLYSIFFRNSRGEFYKDEENRPMGREKGREQREDIAGALAFLLFGLSLRDQFRNAVLNNRGIESSYFGGVLEEAIRRVGIRYGTVIDEIEPMALRGRNAPDIEKILERAEEGEELSSAEIELLRRAGRLNEERLAEAIQDAVED